MPSILASAYTAVEGETNSRRLVPAIAAALAAAAPARNVRRFKYKLFGVISDDGISHGFLINMERPYSKCTRITRPWIAGWPGTLSNRTHDGRKSCKLALFAGKRRRSLLRPQELPSPRTSRTLRDSICRVNGF